ncbi:MAG: hypothetical protein GY780_11990 [bacterium]|nr:hypothetical protein [bacterium]
MNQIAEQKNSKVNPLPFIALGAASLILALWAGLGRIPFALPVGMNLGMLHGPLMVGGFLGTVIAVERASAIGQRWVWMGPALTGLGTVGMLVHTFAGNLPAAYQLGGILFFVGGLFYLAVFALITKRQPTLFNWVMGLGGIFFVAGNLMLFLGHPVYNVVPLWAAFLVLTITGERLELNRLLAPKAGDRALFFVALILLFAGVVSGLVNNTLGSRIWGMGLMVMSGWLFWRDIARKTIKIPGVTRYTAVCLLSGYVWLFLSGGLNVLFPGTMAGFEYDAVWHALFVGFVMTMIFGHAPIIVPALTGVLVRWRNVFYLPLALLHISLLMRIHGDLSVSFFMRKIGGSLNALAVVIFMVVLVTSLQKLKRRGR